MTGPVTGPVFRGGAGNGFEWAKIGYKQKPPYDMNLPYNAYTVVSTASDNLWRWKEWMYAVDTSVAYAKAYERLVEALGDSASLGVTLAQWKEADGMIKARATQLLSFTSAVLRRDPKGIARALGLKNSSDAKSRVRRYETGEKYGTAKKLSDLWLEFWFGWSPMVSDIRTASEVFAQELPNARYKGRGSAMDSFSQAAPPPLNPEWDGFEGIHWDGKARVEVAMDVRLVNPNTHLLNQFGLLNMATVAYDVIPWSFVLGWVSNVGSYLRSLTDFAGLETSNGYISIKQEVGGYTWWTGAFALQHSQGTGQGFRFVRTPAVSLPRPSFRWKNLSVPPTRGLTAITLLTQKLHSVTNRR